MTIATDQPLGSSTRLWLRDRGYSEDSIAGMSAATTLQIDLGLDGDSLEELVKELESRFSVNLSNFDFNLYGTPEAVLLTRYWPHNLLKTWFQKFFASKPSMARRTKQPITLDMIERTLQSRQWQTE